MINMKHVSMRQSGYKIIVVSPENHRKLADIGRKKETFNDIISGLIELKNNTIAQIHPKVWAPEGNVLPSTTRIGDPKPDG